MQVTSPALDHLPNGDPVPPPADSFSEPADSPDTPVNTQTSPVVKIVSDVPEPVSDVRHEPLPINIEKLDDASTRPQVESLDAVSITAEAPPPSPLPTTGEPLTDVHMAEEATPVETPQAADADVTMEEVVQPTTNGHIPAHDGPADESLAATPASPLAASSSTAVESLPADTTNEDRESKPPPAKRARKFSDAEQASVHTTQAPTDVSSRVSTFSAAQHKFAMSTVRTLKKLKDSMPFRQPVDYVKFNIPHYPTIITHPMDFSTIERKLASSNPAKPDPNPNNPRYFSADEFEADVRLIFSNCETFNGPDHFVTQQGRRVLEVFDKQIKHMPAPEEPKPAPVVKKPATPPPPPPPAPAPKKPVRRASQSVPVIRRNDHENNARPKREIHPPPPKDLPYADAPKKARRARGSKKDIYSEQLRYCGKILDQLGRKQHQNIVLPFAEPVDWVKLQIPDYPRIIKRPMDLSTMRRKLENGEYPNPDRFRDDFKLIISNCFTYNSPGTPVNQAGIELQHLFDEKWAHMPPLPTSDEEEEEFDEQAEERSRQLNSLESQMENLRGAIEMLKKEGTGKKEKKEKKKEKAPAPVPSTSKLPKKDLKPPPPKKKAGKKATIPDDDTLTFDQKKDLSEAIQHLDGQKLEKVIQIIHEGVPEIRDSQEEIELEIDTLPPAVLQKLFNFVLKPLRQPATKRNRTAKGTGTGGLKRKSMDEDVEAEKIRVLEARMALFEQQHGEMANAPSLAAVAPAHDSEHSSDSSSDEDSSGSESE